MPDQSVDTAECGPPSPVQDQSVSPPSPLQDQSVDTAECGPPCPVQDQYVSQPSPMQRQQINAPCVKKQAAAIAGLVAKFVTGGFTQNVLIFLMIHIRFCKKFKTVIGTATPATTKLVR